MSGADEARDAIRRTLVAVYPAVHSAGVAYVKAYKDAIASDDLVDTMRNTVLAILAAEQLQAMAEEAQKSARAMLCAQMAETGATSIQTDSQTAYIARKAAWVSIDQEDLLPPDYMRQPPAAPDKKAIKAAIEGGEDVPGCTLVRPNDFSLVIRSKKE